MKDAYVCAKRSMQAGAELPTDRHALYWCSDLRRATAVEDGFLTHHQVSRQVETTNSQLRPLKTGLSLP